MLGFDLSEEHRLLEQSVREWGSKEIAPKIHDLDRAHQFDPTILQTVSYTHLTLPTILLV